MSRLSILFHKEKGEIFHATIQYLENVDLPSSAKQAIAVSVMKAIHVGTGNPWDSEIESGVVSAIDYVLGGIRGWADSFDHPQIGSTPPVQASIYGNFDPTPVPDNTTLISAGFHGGDVVWGYGSAYYTVTPSGGVPPLTGPDGSRVSDAPIRIIG